MSEIVIQIFFKMSRAKNNAIFQYFEPLTSISTSATIDEHSN